MNVLSSYREPLTPTVRRALLLLVIAFHGGLGWLLVSISPAKLIVGDVAAMEVRMVSAEPSPQADPVIESAPEPPPPEIPKPPELALPTEPEMPVFQPPQELATVVEPPPPDLPPPVFPVEVQPPKPPEKPEVAKPTPPKPPPPEKPKPPVPPKAAQPRPPAPQTETAAQSAPSAAPRTVSMSQVSYITPPSTAYPSRSRKAGEQGRVRLLVLVDIVGRPAQVKLQASSGFPLLDEAAINAVRAALFRPYSEGGVPQPVWVVVPIDFVLR